MDYLLWILCGYASGSVMYAYLLPRLVKKIDIRQLSDDGNPGTANVFKYGGRGLGAAVLLCELAKGFLPVYLAAGALAQDSLMFALVMAAPVLGHAFPVWHRANGGKAIAVSFGVMLGLFPETRPLFLLAFFYLLFSMILIIDPHFFRSVITFFLYSIGCFFLLENHAVKWGCAFISAIVVFKHFARYQGERMTVRIGKSVKISSL